MTTNASPKKLRNGNWGAIVTCPHCERPVACRPIEIVAMTRKRHSKTPPRPSGRVEIVDHGDCDGSGLAINLETTT